VEMDKYTFSPHELVQIRALIEECQNSFDSAESESFIKQSRLLASKLPRDLLCFLTDLATNQEHSGLVLISGFSPLKPLPLTPKTWFKEDSYHPDFESDYLAIILASILGDPFGFETQQKGKLIHDIVPIKGREYHQEGASSLQMLNFHCEDTFHPHRADFICLHCLKNPTQVGTIVSNVSQLSLSDDEKKLLSQYRFHHLSDNTHTENVSEPLSAPILFGHLQSYYIRFDYDFTIAKQGDEEAKTAIDRLNQEILASSVEVPIAPGDFCFIDNYKWLHGRKSFKATYDGHDRWLRRFNIKVDINEASIYRRSPESRMLSFDPVHKV
jgi:alpha-ketoglutarate-dependent taurine dioxygenase